MVCWKGHWHPSHSFSLHIMKNLFAFLTSGMQPDASWRAFTNVNATLLMSLTRDVPIIYQVPGYLRWKFRGKPNPLRYQIWRFEQRDVKYNFEFFAIRNFWQLPPNLAEVNKNDFAKVVMAGPLYPIFAFSCIFGERLVRWSTPSGISWILHWHLHADRYNLVILVL